MNLLFKPHRNFSSEKPRKIVPFDNEKELVEHISGLCEAPENDLKLSIKKDHKTKFINWDTHIITLTYTIKNKITIRKRLIAGFINKPIEIN